MSEHEEVTEVETNPDAPRVTGAPTARVADSYGLNPEEHKPSQDAFDPDTADEKQAETGNAPVETEKEETSPGISSSSSETSEPSSPEKSQKLDSEPAQSAELRTKSARTGSPSAGSTGSARSGR